MPVIKYWFVPALVAVTLCSAAIFWWRQQAGARVEKGNVLSSSTDESSTRAVRSIAREVSGLKLELAALRHQAVGSNAAPVHSAETAKTPEPEKSDLSPEDQEELLVQSSMETHQSHFDSEAVDPSWSSDQQAKIAAVFSDVDHSTLANAECKTTICRTTLVHEDEAGREALLESGILGTAPFDTSGFFMPAPDGIGTVVYSARHGHELHKVAW